MITMTRPANARGNQTAAAITHSSKTSVEKTEISAAPKPRASRQPTMPLHMTTRARKTSPSDTDSRGAIQRLSPPPKMSKRGSSISETRLNAENVEPLRKKLRSSQATINGPKQKSPDLTFKLNGSGNDMNSKKEKPSRSQNTQSEPYDHPADNNLSQRSNDPAKATQDTSQVPENSNPTAHDKTYLSPFITDISRQAIHEQYLERSQLSKKNATLEQLRSRQAAIAEQYRLMATLAKEINMVLIDKSIERLNRFHDAELAASAWAQNILAVLEEKEFKRFQQVEYKRKLDLIDARHEYNVMKNALHESYGARILELREKYLGRIMEMIADMQNQHDYNEEHSEDESGAKSTPNTIASTPATSNSLAALNLLALESTRKLEAQLPETSWPLEA